MNNKTYILLKDLPGIPAGSVLIYSDVKQGYIFVDPKCDYEFSQHVIDQSPDFFKVKEDAIYNESDLRKAEKDAFVAAHKYPTFQDYLNSKQK